MSVRMIVSTASIAALMAGVSACASTATVDEGEIAQATEGYVRTGETRTCLNPRLIDTIDPVTDSAWRIEMNDGTMYLNIVGGGCNNASSDFTYLQYETPTGQLCRGEIVQVVDSNGGMFAGSCGLSEFERLEPVAGAE
ncbi:MULTISPECIES: hypothetical protein [Marinicauda]|jgi:hypothetical protein|uniref:hypothetical protein n=1 Tax=Marinicauda TaxID=1649466 RepID=UPI0022E63CB6|nr:hypothetical protein [Marinicauda sp. Alg238-R41]